MGNKKPGLTGLARESAMAATAEQASPWLKGRSFASLKDEFDRSGYLIFERVLAPDRVAELRAALAPHLARDLLGRNDFEGTKDQPRLCAAGEIACLRGARDPSARDGLCRSRARRELSIIRHARDQSASRRDRAALALRRRRRQDPAAPPRPWHQHVLGDRRHDRTERRHRNHSGQPSVGRANHRGRGAACPFHQQGADTTRATVRTPSS